MADFVNIEVEADPEELKESVYAAIQEQWPDWEPADGNLETWLVEAFSNQVVDLAELASAIPEEAFKAYGESVLGVPPQDETPATAVTTWTFPDDEGYTVPADTVVGIAASGSDIVAFSNPEDIEVSPGDTAISGVILQAVEPGVAGNGLSADPELIDAVNYVSNITLESDTAGGLEAEDAGDYLDRLAAELQLLTPRPILPRDFEVLAHRVPGVARAIAIDGYDPSADTFNNERMVAVAAIDEDGEAVASPVKAEVQSLLDGMREINFVVDVMDPDYTTVDVSAKAIYREGFDPAIVELTVTTRLEQALSPALWGQGTDDPNVWARSNTLYINDLIAVVSAVPGVRTVKEVKVCVHGAGPPVATDLALNGPASLTRPGDMAVTIEAS